MILVTARMEVQEADVDEFIEAVRTVVAATTANEPGCSAYDCSRDVLDPTQFVFVEQWEDMAAIGGHVKSEHYQAFSKVADRILSNQTVTLHTVEKSRTL